MLLNRGEKVHVITRRTFEDDIRRHFVGEIAWAEGAVARVEGFVFVHNPNSNEFIRRVGRRTRIFDLSSSNHVVNILPAEFDLAQARYATTRDRRLVLTDGKSCTLDINEFSAVG